MILFSPIGITDPLRNFSDGPMLHIVRHYRERGLRKVILFYTQATGKTARDFDPYKRVIQAVAPEIEIEEIFTDIDKPHLFDEFINIFPQKIRELHEQSPKEKILLNVSSGTPQMQSTLAILAVEYPYTLAVQVETPLGGANRDLPHTSDKEDFELQLDDMTDSKPDAKNRCREPQLKTIRKFADKGRILSLIERYEYEAAFELAEHNEDIPAAVKKLLLHGGHRMKFRLKDACKVIDAYNGENLCPFDGTKKTLTEYYLTIDVDQKRGDLFSVIIKAIPFLFELLLDVVFRDDKMQVKRSCVYEEKTFRLQRHLLAANNPKLLAYLDKEFSTFRNNMSLSSRNLAAIVCFGAGNSDDADKRELYRKLHNILSRLGQNFFTLRNEVAHTITDVDEKKFRLMVGLPSAELVKNFFELMLAVFGEDVRKQRGFYDKLNRWVQVALEK